MDLTFYKNDGTTEAASIGTSGLDVKTGIIGGFIADATSLSSTRTGGSYRIRFIKPTAYTSKVFQVEYYDGRDWSPIMYLSMNGIGEFAEFKVGYTVQNLGAKAKMYVPQTASNSGEFRIGKIASNSSGTFLIDLTDSTASYVLVPVLDAASAPSIAGGDTANKISKRVQVPTLSAFNALKDRVAALEGNGSGGGGGNPEFTG